MLEPFTPVAQSLEWRLGSLYWQTRGQRAFTSNEVPHLVTNDGVRARRAADVLFTSCDAAQRDGRLEARIVVVEQGIGLGLHAKILLDRFRDRCQQTGRDYYDRLVYHATDFSRRTLEDVARRGTLATHAEHVRLGTNDALNPTTIADLASDEVTRLAGVRAFLHNYLLDVMPFEVLRIDRASGQWLRLCLQTRIDDLDLARRVDSAAWQRLTSGNDRPTEDAVLPFYELLRSERAYFPCRPDALLKSAAAERFIAESGRVDGFGDTMHLLHSGGAVQVIEGALALLRDDGFVLFSDYGFTSDEQGQVTQHQRYGGSRSMGVNVALLESFVAGAGATWIAPDDGKGALLSRLVQRTAQPDVASVFRRAFAAEPLESIDRLVADARAARDRGDGRAAHAHYTLAHQQAPECWTILLEWSNLATFVLGDPRTGVALSERAIAINPTCSAAVWDEHGDALYALGRYDEALRAFQRAYAIDPEHPRTHVNLAWIEADHDRFEEAIRLLGHALALDTGGAYRPVITKKLGEILDRRDARRARMRR